MIMSGADETGNRPENPKTDARAELDKAGKTVRQSAEDVGRDLARGGRDYAEAEKGRAADGVETVASHARDAAEELREQDLWVADLVDRGARELDQFAGALKARSLPELAGSLEDMARRRPGAFMAGSVALGFMLARFARASSPGRDRGVGPEPTATANRPASADLGHRTPGVTP
jgi:hypothetical protein